MVTLSLTRLAAAVGGLTLSLTGAGAASADPDLSPVINTTCNYSQVVSALNAQTPVAASQLNASPSAQAALRSKPQSQQFFELYGGFVVHVANTCNNY